MKKIRPIAILCIMALCAGCGAQPKVRKLTESSVIVAFGDSLTAGTGAGKTESYPAVLMKSVKGRVVNAGVPGEDSSAGLLRLPAVLESERPDLVILCHGGNDMLRKQDRDFTKANLNAMISMVKAAGADVVLIGVPGIGLRLKSPSLYRELAEQHHIPFDPDCLPEILSTPMLKSDQVHPNAAGYRRLAESVETLIRKSESE